MVSMSTKPILRLACVATVIMSMLVLPINGMSDEQNALGKSRQKSFLRSSSNQKADANLDVDETEDFWEGMLRQLATSMPAAPTMAPTKKPYTCRGIGWGDIHFQTFDGLQYDCHAPGEIVLVKSLDSPFEIQARSTEVGGPTVTTGVAIREYSQVNGTLPLVQVSMNTMATSNRTTTVSGCPIAVYVEGMMVQSFSEVANLTANVVEASRSGSEIVLSYPSTGLEVTLDVNYYKGVCYFSGAYVMEGSECRESETLVGILGTPTGNRTDDWTLSNGTVLELPEGAFATDPITTEYCAEHWCLRDVSDSLFTYEVGTNFSTFENCDNPSDLSDVLAAVANASDELKELCDGNIACLIDGVTLGIEAAEQYLEFMEENPVLTRSPTEAPTVSPTPMPYSCRAIGWGDIHFNTFDGLLYDCHADGELILVKSLDSPFEIQARSTVVSGGPSVTTGVAIKEYTQEDGGAILPVVEVSMNTQGSSPATADIQSCSVSLYVDGEFLSGFDEAESMTNGTVAVTRNGGEISVDYPSTGLVVQMEVHHYHGVCYFNVLYLMTGSECREHETLTGVLGSPNGDYTDDWMTADGTVLNLPNGTFSHSAGSTAYCAEHWCNRNATNSLFTYEAGTNFSTFENCDNIADLSDTMTAIENASNELKKICNGDIGCLMDGVTLGVEAAESYLDFAEENPLLTRSPTEAPTSTPTLSLEDQNNLVTCVSVIDENNGRVPTSYWNQFRAAFPDRPMCLLQPGGKSSALGVPAVFYDYDINIYEGVTRDGADSTATSDWYEICEMEESRLRGLTKVVLFVDNSGSMTTGSVRNAYNLFFARMAEHNLTVVSGVYNGNEDYISPCFRTNLS